MSARLTTVEPQHILINADRRLAFQVLTAFGAKAPDGSATQVLQQRNDARLVRFTTPFPALGAKLNLVTDEWVTATQPQHIRFQLERGRGIMAAFAALDDIFILEDRNGMTRMTYESAFALRGGLLGHLIARAIMRRVMRGFMRSHLKELKHTIEQRAARSKLYPQRKP